MNVTTLGRGASDITAVALSAALNADRCEIYTDVAGIYTADPRLVPKAQKLNEVGFEEMLELASYGAKMAPRSIELGMVYDIPILVASSLNDEPGTLIHRGAEMSNSIGEIRNRVRGVATDINVTKITLLGIPNRPGSEADVFEPLADADISVDVIVQSTVVDGHTDLTFTIKGTDKERALAVMTKISQEIGARGVTAADGLAKVSIVGSGMQDAPGYASKMFRALADAEISIDVITTSEIRITCVIDACDIKNAAQAIHSAFLVESTE
jgi:aspartate kinase